MRAALMLVAGATLACGSSEKAGPPITRDRDAAAVVIVKGTSDSVSYGDEVEPNDEPSAAQALDVPGGVRGSLDGETDVDLYRIKVVEAGWLNARVSGIDGVDLVLELRGVDGAVIARSDRGPAKTVEGLPNYRVDAGSYLVAISEFVKKSRKKKGPRTGASPSYKLSVTVATEAPPRGHEVEPNEGNADAMELLLGVDGFGYVGWKDDTDRWRLTLDNFGPDYSLDIDVAPVPDVRLSLRVLDDNGDPILRRAGDKGKAVAVRNLVPRKGDDHVYIEIGGRGSNPLERYAVRLGSRLMDLDEEREPNDDRAQAVEIEGSDAAGTRRGYLVPGDEDWYALTVKGSQLMSVNVAPPGDVDVTLAIARADGTTLGEGNAGKAGEKEELTGVPVGPGRVLVRVSGTGSADSLEPYTLRWTLAPAGAAPSPTYDPYE